MTAVINPTRSRAAALLAVLLLLAGVSGLHAQEEPMHFEPLVAGDGTLTVGVLTVMACFPVEGIMV